MNSTSLVYHHWFRQSDGFRDNGENDPGYLDHKTCPGTAFFGGNKVDNATANFLPLVQQAYDNYQNNTIPENPTPKTGVVNADVLNVRSGPGADFAPVDQLKRNATVTILESNDEWGRIGDDRWVFSDYIAINS
ncbi:SH3 domain-containing protein [Mucilaginibacter sp. McL0603]|uniref:SH3 domain-containing protein n=1 Tax=Mucilaginibacter sp. McL0603 TaxID=3415670 RepID=UPI003CEC1B24